MVVAVGSSFLFSSGSAGFCLSLSFFSSSLSLLRSSLSFLSLLTLVFRFAWSVVVSYSIIFYTYLPTCLLLYISQN